MDKTVVLTGVCKYYRVGSKGNRYKIIIDDPKISNHFQNIIDKSIADHKIDNKTPFKFIHHFLRNRKIEIRLI